MPANQCFNPRAPRGARHAELGCEPERMQGFNPRAPRGARLGSVRNYERHPEVSIHAPRAGRDFSPHASRKRAKTFQSTRPARGATDSVWIAR